MLVLLLVLLLALVHVHVLVFVLKSPLFYTCYIMELKLVAQVVHEVLVFYGSRIGRSWLIAIEPMAVV